MAESDKRFNKAGEVIHIGKGTRVTALIPQMFAYPDTPCDIEKLHLSRGELGKANEFLVGNREYVCAGCFPDRFRKPDKTLDYDKIREDFQAKIIMDSYNGTGYWYNPIEIDAKSVGELLRDKFEAFLAAIK